MTIPELWTKDVTEDSYPSKELFYAHIFEQYKTCIEMADRISSRRNATNTFFLSLHSFLIGAAGFLYEKGPVANNIWVNVFLLFGALVLCYGWYRLINLYRQLNTAKFKVIGEYEKVLPTSPFWNAEWAALGFGMDPKLYRSLSDVERWVPMLFSFLYIGMFLAIMMT